RLSFLIAVLGYRSFVSCPACKQTSDRMRPQRSLKGPRTCSINSPSGGKEGGRPVAQEKTQTFENHNRVVPAYHMFVFGVFLINLVCRLLLEKKEMTFASIMNVLLGAEFVVLFF